MYCTKCGNLCGEMDNVCTRCGEKLSDKAYESYSKAQPSYSSDYNNNYNTNTNYYAHSHAYAQPYAGFWIRFGAHIIDGIILNIGVLILSGILGGILGVIIGVGTIGGSGWNSDTDTFASLLSVLIALCSGWLYAALFESSSYQATLGKMAVGIKVVDLDGNRISFGRATGRYFSKIISGLTFSIGYIMAGFTDKKQALHDMIAGTLVISK